jgi:hypothetical protein
MGESGHAQGRAGAPVLLHYRPWNGPFAAPVWSVWPIARTALGMMFRRKLFWGLYALGMMVFLLFFFGQYLVAFSDNVNAPGENRPGGLRQLIYRALPFLDGTGDMFLTFIRYQGYILMVVLALAGSVILGNDLRFGSLPYYLSKPLTPAVYLLGKGLAVAVFVNLMTTVPALLLWLEFALLYPGSYPVHNAHLLVGVLGYGLVLTVAFTLLLLAATMWVQRTVPLIMVWSTLFIFLRVLADALVDRLRFDPSWRLIDLWNNATLVGGAMLGQADKQAAGGNQPSVVLALAVLLGVSLLCVTYLIRRIRAVDILR